MNTTTASCGHSVIAVGAPGSPARLACEATPCGACLSVPALENLTMPEAVTKARDYVAGIKQRVVRLYASRILSYMLSWSRVVPNPYPDLTKQQARAIRAKLAEMLPNGRTVPEVY